MYIYPLVFDANGQPVTDLTSADFKIVDQGKPGNIVFFHAPRAQKTAAAGKLEYSNRPGGKTPHAVAILFDLMNESQPDRLDMWHALDKSLPKMESGDSVYFYILTLEGELFPIHPIGPPAADDHNWPQDVAGPLDKAMKTYSHARPAHLGQEDQVKKTFHDLEVLANQLSALPGRKDIVWITGGVQNVYNTKLPCNGDWVDCALYVPHLAVTLAHADVAVNPLSNSRDLVSGVTRYDGQFSSGGDMKAKANANDVFGDQQAGPNAAAGPDPTRDLEQMGRLTGGHAFFRQEVPAVVQQLAADAGNMYEIAYQPASDNWDNKFHVIHINCERKGVKLQSKERYFALPDTRSAAEKQRAAVMAAFQSPYNVAEIGMNVKVSPAQGGIHFDLRIDPSDVMLHEDGGKFTGGLVFFVSDRGASGPLGDPTVSPLGLDLTKAQYDTVMKEGMPISQDHAVGAAVTSVRLMVLDQNSEAVGSVTFPVK
ncbi:MAG TPA: VWA domain-containing protein [Bryobacteraceae bacterium]|nr:VWA domain-containing protein [Bryobacteraceae bacterium]